MLEHFQLRKPTGFASNMQLGCPSLTDRPPKIEGLVCSPHVSCVHAKILVWPIRLLDCLCHSYVRGVTSGIAYNENKVTRTLAASLGYKEMKPEQDQANTAFLSGINFVDFSVHCACYTETLAKHAFRQHNSHVANRLDPGPPD